MSYTTDSVEADMRSSKAIEDSLRSCIDVISTYGHSLDFVAGAEDDRDRNLDGLQKAVTIMQEMPTLGGLYGLSVLEWARDILKINVPGYETIEADDFSDSPVSPTMH